MSCDPIHKWDDSAAEGGGVYASRGVPCSARERGGEWVELSGGPGGISMDVADVSCDGVEYVCFSFVAGREVVGRSEI